MAARSASIASFVLLLLLLLVAVPSSSNHVKLDLHGNIYPDGEFYTTVKIGEQAKEYNLHVDTGSVLTWVQCSVPPGYCKGPCKKWQQPYDYYELIPAKVVKASLHRSLREVEDPAMELCWRGAGMFGSVYEVKPLFKTLALVFKKANKIISTLEIPPENYLIISGNGNVCFAIHPNPVVGGMNVIGAVTMQDRIIIYDNEAKQIGWVHGPCGTESEPEITSRL
ncbi:hypothetical protein PR202_ga06553 [Eleusine coracana subsp. coracana]|uniref:Peptidase A1 domain-containing protein n=1 Tax=Eleusine coracana subsp. coracana TaxID=191504 RepID=A0AAV5BWC5_ELECO|nr:hypothetical protein PR202_ga06553 [Eleusine coracana subsp. coracana]